MAPMIFPILIQQQQHGGALVSEAPPSSQYASYTVDVAAWGFYADLVAETDHGVKSVRISRGRDDALTAMRAGTATVVLHDPDGLYNPENASSPLAGSLLPMSDISIQATNDGGSTYWPLFRGFIRSIEHDPRIGVQETRIECIDLFVALDQVKPIFQLGGAPFTTGDLITAAVNYTGAGLGITADAGDSAAFPEFFANGDRSSLQIIEELLVAERGVFYIQADGVARYEQRSSRTARTSEATITDTMMSLRPGVDLDRVANRARVTRTGGDQQEANDLTSQALYGVRDVGDIESPYLDSDADALALAEYLVDQFKDPRSPMFSLEQMNRSAATMDQILQRELQDRITVSDSRGGTSGDYHLEAIEHEITEGGKWHRCNWILSARGAGTQTGSTGIIGGTKTAPPPPAIYAPTSSAIPTAPVDGRELYYRADATNGVVWHFRYNAQASGSYKWEFVGGSPIVVSATGTTTRAVSAYGDVAAGAMTTVTLPFAGDYLIQVGATMQPGAVGFGVFASFSVAGATALDTDAAEVYSGAVDDIGEISASNLSVKTGLAAGTTIQQKFKAQGPTTAATIKQRWIAITPRRVSA